MTKIKVFALLIAIAPMLAGCMTATGASKIIKEGKGDAAAVIIDFTGFGGTFHGIRINPMTNTIPYSISRDGTVTVDQRCTTGAML